MNISDPSHPRLKPAGTRLPSRELLDPPDLINRFLGFFEERSHRVVEPSPLTLLDPTLLFVNSGMVPLKPYLLGELEPPERRLMSVQPCIRTGDIEEVGRTDRHLTSFQMLGNFSLGEYFRQESIRYCWGLLTRSTSEGGYGLPESRLWVSVHEEDSESEGIWSREIGVSPSRIQRRGRSDNLWSMGVEGPCGFCTEVFYDRGPEHGKPGGPVVDEERYVEIWNLVFMDQLRGPGRGDEFELLGPLPQRNVDTGLGLDRLSMVVEESGSVHESSHRLPLLELMRERTGSGDERRLRTLSDHLRTSVQICSEGVRPRPTGQGFVLRRLLRRMSVLCQELGRPELLDEEVLRVCLEGLSRTGLSVRLSSEELGEVLSQEYSQLQRTRERGERVLSKMLRGRSSQHLEVEEVVDLHTTHGLSVEVVRELCERLGASLSLEGFEELLDRERERSRGERR